MSRYDKKWIVDFYDAYGDEEWQRWDRTPADAAKLHVHSHYIKQCVRSGDAVLEVGAGPGRYTQILAELGAAITVVDISPKQLELNRQYAKQLGFESGVRAWLRLDICDMSELQENSYDVVVCYGGPLSYVFDKRDDAMREMVRVVKPTGTILLSVMSLWGSAHESLLAVLDISPAENAEIIRSGDLHPDTYKKCTHNMHLFTSVELRALLERHGVTVTSLSASNCLTAAWGDRLSDLKNNSAKWAELLALEVEACRQPGCIDLGTHIIAAGEARAEGSSAPKIS
jgi:2-polyprenyl-3-methyl-5-hydroxy-6-metoxy-1,4-benzoquinol methylase